MAEFETIVTDMGNGGAYCVKCGYCLDGGDPLQKVPDRCPQCEPGTPMDISQEIGSLPAEVREKVQAIVNEVSRRWKAREEE